MAAAAPHASSEAAMAEHPVLGDAIVVESSGNVGSTQAAVHSPPAVVYAAPVMPGHSSAAAAGWEVNLDKEVQAMLASGSPDVWDEMSRRFESRLIVAALACTKGRRIDAAHKLGIGRNTITRKIQELGLDNE